MQISVFQRASDASGIEKRSLWSARSVWPRAKQCLVLGGTVLGGAIRHRVFIPVVIPQLHLVGVTTLWQFAVSFAYPIIWHTAIPDPQQPMRRCTVTRARVHICASACTVLVRVHRTLVCASACVHAYARACTGTRTQVHIHRHRQTDTHTHTHTYTRWDTHTHTHPQVYMALATASQHSPLARSLPSAPPLSGRIIIIITY